MNPDERYKLVRWHFKCDEGWQRKGNEHYRTRADAEAAYTRARVEDGAWPDLIDTKTGDYIK